MDDVLTILLAGGRGTRLEFLTRDRAKPSYLIPADSRGELCWLLSGPARALGLRDCQFLRGLTSKSAVSRPGV
jgi:dTDP-glucose pyrophosphorylase